MDKGSKKALNGAPVRIPGKSYLPLKYLKFESSGFPSPFTLENKQLMNIIKKVEKYPFLNHNM
jgi:hypothetical protein